MKKIIPLLLMAILLVSMAYAVCTFVRPTTSYIYKGNPMRVNATCAVLVNATNCTVTASSALTGDSVTIILYNKSLTTNTTYLNGTFDSTARVDASDWIFSGTCTNKTAGLTEALTSVTAIIDNGVPTCTVSTALANHGTYAQAQTWAITGTNGTAATITFGTNSPLAMTEVTDTFTYLGNAEQIPLGSYPSVVFTVSDGLNSTTCTLTDIVISNGANVIAVGVGLAGEGAKGAEGQAGQAAGNANIIYLVILGAIALYFMKKKRK